MRVVDGREGSGGEGRVRARHDEVDAARDGEPAGARLDSGREREQYDDQSGCEPDSGHRRRRPSGATPDGAQRVAHRTPSTYAAGANVRRSSPKVAECEASTLYLWIDSSLDVRAFTRTASETPGNRPVTSESR